MDIPIYETKYNDKQICLVLGCLGAAGAAYELEQLIALGCNNTQYRKFLLGFAIFYYFVKAFCYLVHNEYEYKHREEFFVIYKAAYRSQNGDI